MKKFRVVIALAVIAALTVFVSGCTDGGKDEEIKAGPITFTDEEGHILLDGSQIEKAIKILGGSEYAVELVFTEDGQAAFAKATGDNIGRKILIKVGDQLISESEITERLDIDKCVIRGNYTEAKAEEIVNAINQGLSSSKSDTGDDEEDKEEEKTDPPEKTEAAAENQVTFTDENGIVLLKSSHIEKVSGVENNGKYGIKFEFTAEGRGAFADATANNIGQVIYVKLGDKVISKSSISERIDSNTCVVTGSFTKESLKEMVDAINEGLNN